MPSARPLLRLDLLIVCGVLLCGVLLLSSCLVQVNWVDRQVFINETAAMQAIRTIHAAQLEYQSRYGRFASSLTELGPRANQIPSDLANCVMQGYHFALTATPDGYTVNAKPVRFPADGRRTFFSDQTMLIHVNYGPEPATANSRVDRPVTITK